MRAMNRGGRPIVERVPRIDVRWKPKEARFAPPLPELEQAFPFPFEGRQYVAVMVWEPVACGWRRWFRCDVCRHRRATLYIYRGRLACRCCHRLGYLSERVRRADRLELIYSRFRQRHGLGAAAGQHVSDPLLPRCKGQHRATYARHVERAQQLYAEWEAVWLETAEGRWALRMLERDAARGL